MSREIAQSLRGRKIAWLAAVVVAVAFFAAQGLQLRPLDADAVATVNSFTCAGGESANCADVTGGKVLTYTGTATSTGADGSMTLSITLPPGFSIAAPPPTCPGGTGPINLGNQVNCIFPQGTAGATLTVRATPPVQPNGAADIPGLTALFDAIDNVTISTLTVVSNLRTPDLAITKAGPATVAAGTSGSYTVVVSNNDATQAAYNVDVDDVVPSPLIPTSASTTQGTCNAPVGQSVHCDIGTLFAGGGFATVTINFNVPTNIVNGTPVNNRAVGNATNINPGIPSNIVATTITSVASMELTKVPTKSTVTSTPVENFAWLIQVKNTGTAPLTNVQVIDPTLDGATGRITQDPDPQNYGNVNCRATGNTLTGQTGGTCVMTENAAGAPLFTLPAGASFTISVGMRTVLGAAEGDVLNSISASSNETGPIGPSFGTVTIENQPFIVVNKFATGNQQVGYQATGPVGTFVVRVENLSPTDTATVVITDPITSVGGANSLVFLASSSCPAALVSGPGGHTVALGPLGVFQCSINVALPNGVVFADGSSIVNEVTARVVETGEIQKSAATLTAVVPELSIVKSSSGTTTATSGSFTIVVTNTGSAPATNVTLADAVDSRLTIASTNNCAAAGQNVTANYGTLAPGATETCTINVRPAAGVADGTVVGNSATADSNQTPAVSDDADITVSVGQLAITKTNHPTVVGQGGVVTSTITVSNTGSQTVTGVEVHDDLPAGATFVASSSSGACFAMGADVHCTDGNLAAGSSVVFTVVWLAPNADGDYTNVATTLNASGVTNVSATADVTVVSATGVLVHVDVDVASEHESGNFDGVLDIQDDPDDATGSLHTVCLISADLGIAENANISWSITAAAGSPATVSPAPAGTKIVLNLGLDTESNCVQWRSGGVGGQNVTATYSVTGEMFFWQGTAPIIKEWNTIDFTRIVSVNGNVGTTLAGNSGELDNWVSAPTNECVRDDDAKTTDVNCVDRADEDGSTHVVTGGLLTASVNQGYLFTQVSPSYIEYAIGSHDNYDGPIDGVEQTFTISGTCGSVRIEDPVTGNSRVIANDGPGGFPSSTTIINSDKGVGFQFFATDNGVAAANALDLDLDCRPDERTTITITSEEDVQLRSDLDTAPSETVTVHWRVAPPVNKQPILAWAGQRVILEHNWRETLGSHNGLCPFTTGGEDPKIYVMYLKQAQGPGGFGAMTGFTFNDIDLTTDAVIVEVDVDPVAGEPNSDCISRVIYESQDAGEVDVSAYIIEPGDDLNEADPVSNEVDFLIYFMKLESIELGIVEGTWSGHNSGTFTRSDGHPFDASKDVTETTSNVSADVLVRARVKGWFVTQNLTQREAGIDSTGLVLPAGRFVMPDDWALLAGCSDADGECDAADTHRPNYDIMVDPTDNYTCDTTGTICQDIGDVINTTTGATQDEVAGPFSLLDGPNNDDGKAPFIGGGFRDTWLDDGVINETDAPMPPALVRFTRTGSGILEPANKRSVYDSNPFYVTHIPAEPWLTPFTADGQGYRWDTWGVDGAYVFWSSWLDGSDGDLAMVYTDNHGEAMVIVNGDDAPGGGLLNFAECSDAASLTENGIVSLSGEYCEEGDLVGSTTVSATADYPDKRKHTPVASNEVSIDWAWAGYKHVTIQDGENQQFKYVVIHVLDRDGYCADSPSLHPVEDELIEFTLDVIGGGRIVGVSNDGTIGTLGQSATTTLAEADDTDLIEELTDGECQAWVKISNSLLGVTDVLVTAHDPEGTPVFDRIVDFATQVEYTLHFRWTLITWPGEDGIAVGDALTNDLGDISDEVTAVYGWDPAAQVWLAYFPDGVGVPGANDLSTLSTGQAYWIAIAGPADVTWHIAVGVD